MESEGKKVYVPPLVTVRPVMLESVMADAIKSFSPVVKSGEVEYTDYEDMPDSTEGSVVIF
jgi:hypothetical protein